MNIAKIESSFKVTIRNLNKVGYHRVQCLLLIELRRVVYSKGQMVLFTPHKQCYLVLLLNEFKNLILIIFFPKRIIVL